MTVLDSISDPGLASLVARWRDLLTEQDVAVVEQAGYGRPIAPGRRAALVLVDFQRAYVGDDVPILDQLDRWPSAGGSSAWAALDRARMVIDAFREAGLPVIFTRVGYTADDAASNPFTSKRGGGSGFVLGTSGTEIVLDMRDGETLITKTAASAFYGTEVDEILAANGVDTLVVCGLSTSGCVRATAVDGAARGFRVYVVADACGDRIETSHDIALFDVWLKYGAVVTAEAATRLVTNMDEQPTDTRDSGLTTFPALEETSR